MCSVWSEYCSTWLQSTHKNCRLCFLQQLVRLKIRDQFADLGGPVNVVTYRGKSQTNCLFFTCILLRQVDKFQITEKKVSMIRHLW